VTQAIDGSESAYCKYCFSLLLPRVACLAKHEDSVKHQRKAAAIEASTKRSIPFVSPPSPGGSFVDSLLEDVSISLSSLPRARIRILAVRRDFLEQNSICLERLG
jgi:hypothetical protein